MLLHDNTPVHCVNRVRSFLAQRGVPIVDHIPYSPDLAPVDFFLFPLQKNVLKASFADLGTIQEHVTPGLRSIINVFTAVSFRMLD